MTWNKPAPRVKLWDGDSLPTPRDPHGSYLMSAVKEESLLEKTRPLRIFPKTADRSAAIRESARGEECQVRYPGICNGGTDHTIWSHARWGAQLGDAGRSGARKALDICGAYACTACDAAYDGQKQVVGMKRHEIDLDWCMAHFRSLAILKQKGLL